MAKKVYTSRRAAAAAQRARQVAKKARRRSERTTNPAKPRDPSKMKAKHLANTFGGEMTIAERQTEAMRLRKSGLSFAQIAVRLGCDKETARLDVLSGLEELAQERMELAKTLKAQEDEKLEEMAMLLKRHLMAERATDASSISNAIVKIVNLRADLWGLKAPVKVELGKGDPIKEMSDEELAKQSAEAAAQVAALAETGGQA